MTNKFDITQDVLTNAGFEVREDSDQQGLYVWVRIQNGRVAGGADMSLPSENLAWEQAGKEFSRILEDDLGVSQSAWAEMVGEERLALARKYGTARKPGLGI